MQPHVRSRSESACLPPAWPVFGNRGESRERPIMADPVQNMDRAFEFYIILDEIEDSAARDQGRERRCVCRRAPEQIQPDYSSGILAGGSTFEYQKASPAIVANVNRLREIARRHGVSLKAAALQFSLTHPAAGRGHSCGQPAGTRFAEDHAALAESIHADFWHELQNEKLIDPHGSTAEKRPIMKERPPDE